MRWRKLGPIYSPRPVHPKLLSHAANPLPILLEGDTYRVFFSGRDAENRSSVGYVDVDITQQRVMYVHDKPAFEHGPNGSFYERGVSIGNCYAVGGRTYMLFMGWQQPPGGHWRGDIGRLLVGSDLSLSLDGSEAFLCSNGDDPISLSYPWVMPAGRNYLMWYGSTLTWDGGNGEMVHVINHATSRNGHQFERKGLAIPFEVGVAQAFSRPTVAGTESEGYDMWFSYRSGTGQSYRIGYARKDPDAQWQLRLGETGLDVSASGWDSEMIEYPFVFDHKGQRYMLYNGNGFGQSGFGLAILEQ
jgi:hypothetical protein